jgi:membrane protein YqaA with SNARE-associated domain
MLGNLLKLIIVVGLLFTGLYLVQRYIFDLNEVLEEYLTDIPIWLSYLVFLVSESIVGLLPPDVFIVWSERTSNPILVLSGLALISYLAGYIAYQLGATIGKFRRLRNYLNRKYASHIISFNKWGGILIILAAIFPIPWGVICSIAGLMKFPQQRFLLFALTRFPRFYLYAIALYHII